MVIIPRWVFVCIGFTIMVCSCSGTPLEKRMQLPEKITLSFLDSLSEENFKVLFQNSTFFSFETTSENYPTGNHFVLRCEPKDRSGRILFYEKVYFIDKGETKFFQQLTIANNDSVYTPIYFEKYTFFPMKTKNRLSYQFSETAQNIHIDGQWFDGEPKKVTLKKNAFIMHSLFFFEITKYPFIEKNWTVHFLNMFAEHLEYTLSYTGKKDGLHGFAMVPLNIPEKSVSQFWLNDQHELVKASVEGNVKLTTFSSQLTVSKWIANQFPTLKP